MSSKLLNNRQENFARLVARGDLSNTEAARRAGYRHPDRMGHRLRKVPEIQRMVAEIRSNIRDPAEALEEYLEGLERIRDAAVKAGQYAAALKAHLAIGRALGLLDKPQLDRHPGSCASAAELASRIADRLSALTKIRVVAIDLDHG